MRKMAELQMSVVTDPKSKQAIQKQIAQWEENLEKLYIDQYRFRCYSASLQGSELPNPKVCQCTGAIVLPNAFLIFVYNHSLVVFLLIFESVDVLILLVFQLPIIIQWRMIPPYQATLNLAIFFSVFCTSLQVLPILFMFLNISSMCFQVALFLLH